MYGKAATRLIAAATLIDPLRTIPNEQGGISALDVTFAVFTPAPTPSKPGRVAKTYVRGTLRGKQAESVAQRLQRNDVCLVHGTLAERPRLDAQGVKQRNQRIEIEVLEILDASGFKQGQDRKGGRPIVQGGVNEIEVNGNIAQTPDFRDLGSFQVLTFNVAVKQSYRKYNPESGRIERVDAKNTTFLTVKVYNDDAVRLKDTLTQGSPVAVLGHLVNESWKDDEQHQRYNVTIEARPNGVFPVVVPAAREQPAQAAD